MSSSNARGNADGTHAVNELQAEVLFSTRMWDGLRDVTVQALGRERWREVMMAALNNCDEKDEDPRQIPIHRLLEEVVFTMGISKSELLEGLGRRMMHGLLVDAAPWLKQVGGPGNVPWIMLERMVSGDLGVIGLSREYPVEEGGAHGILMTAIALFKGSAAFHLGALKELGDQVGMRFHIILLGSGEVIGKEHITYRISWSNPRG